MAEPFFHFVTPCLRLARTLLGSLLAAASIVSTVAAGSVVAAMTYLFFTEASLSPHDRATWLWALGCLPVGVFLSWTSVGLANYGRPARQQARSLLPDPESVQRAERFPGANTLCLLAIAAAAGWQLSAGGAWDHAVRAAGWAVGSFLLLHAYLLWHELGHLAAGFLVGLEPLKLRVGAGPVLWKNVTPRGFWSEWRLWPTWGFALFVDRQARPVAWRFFVAILGGPLVGGLFMALALWAMWRAGSFEAVRLDPARLDHGSFLAALSLLVVVSPAVACLVPSSRVREGKTFFSDGWWLCRAFFLPGSLFRERAYNTAGAHLSELWHAGFRAQAQRERALLITRFPQRQTALTLLESFWHRRRKELPEATACFQRGLEESAALTPSHRAATLAQHAAILALADEPDAARACCETVLAALPEAERVRYLDAFACIPIYHRTAALLPDAERWCAEALERSPASITLRATRSAILSEQGRHDEAAPILQEVLAAADSSDNDRGIASFYLALAATRRGQRRDARRLRTDALRWCKVPAVLRRVHAELRSR